ncbi:AT-hook motif nuclear-localized protein 11-like isoform X1 [Typha latifolia]|uniref:AT-hook motif nuclear-localized protein 11-like isoform X1 n=1 Tax=Typha latifolia TaxID=4733 RepID=UPI003C2C78D9
MDGRESMAISTPASYYIQRGIGSTGSPLMRSMPNPNASLAINSSIELAFHGDSPAPMPPAIAGHGAGVRPATMGPGEPVKRKRGRPRKYGPDGSVALGLSPASAPSAISSGSASSNQKRGRGRPPGTGRKQQLALLGEWVAGSAGMGFTPHVIRIAVGEDISSKIMSFSQQGPRAICILSATGAVSSVTLRQPATSGGTATYEGRFEILCLSGSYMMTEDGGSRSRTGGLSISLSSPDGRVIGGGVGGLLIAATPVQVVVGSFIHGGTKAKNKVNSTKEPGPEFGYPTTDDPTTAVTTLSNQNITPAIGGWPASRHADIRPAHIDIDLTRG